VWPKEAYIRSGLRLDDPFTATRDDKTAMWHFVKILDHLLGLDAFIFTVYFLTNMCTTC